ncbi:tyrosine-type recombinase/integrase [Pseudomonas fluorescens]|uniref:tyrosine-type recombinase/integrase n=1 Tax=Pseudomonas fluorescens TaxID=294 RepID=UPI00259B724E|nr:tyrosine-type recombinase/integrase [Pseudomonas fluorescens]WJK11899.1 tyrosine-type recombinase/integrase [Pseudomonas fluorescens]
MKVKYVKEINWSGGPLSTYAILEDGPLTEQSIVPAPTLFLIHLAQEGQLPNSIRSCAHDLRSFFEALEAHDQDWKLLTNADMSGYLYGHLKVARSCSDKSIRRHISTLKLFYAHAWGLGMLDAPASFSYHFIPDEQKKQGDGKKRVNFDLYNKYVEKDIFERLLGSIKTQSAFEKERDELVLHMGYYCGLRSAEVTDSRNLLTSDLRARIAQAEKADEQTITVPIIGKGEKLRQIDIPPKAFKKIKHFLEGRRSSIVDGPLICTRHGKALFSGHATNTFKSARIAASAHIDDVLTELHLKDPHLHFLTKPSFLNLTFHALRHTYATNLVDFCYKHGYDPWQYVPEQMGHEDEATTKEYVIFDGKLHRREKIRRALNDDHDD